MKIRKITIRNFRGIKEFDWNLPNADIFCLIGKGDSSKSTILEALRYAFYPQWNPIFTDADFYQCKVENSIVIEVVIGDLTLEFSSNQKYGHHQRGWDKTTQKLFDECDDHLESVLTVRLTVGKELEPNWIVVTDRTPEGVPFKHVDRSKVSVGLIGAFSEKQLSWAAGTALAKLTEAQSLNDLLATASRTARISLDADRLVTLKNFDAAAVKSEGIAKLLGVPVTSSYQAHLDLNSISLKAGGLALHDGDMPLRQLGLGSRRMLLCGIQQVGLDERHITLFDEVEYGLEPHRISRLIKHVREDKRGQYFLTTHSPVVLRELTISELYVVHSNGGNVQIIAASSDSLKEHEVQGKIRSSAEAFLAKKVVVCEGATEVGFLRGFDDFQIAKGGDPFSYHGVAFLNAGGAGNVKGLAKAFKGLCYDVAVLADADAPKLFSLADEEELKKLKINVYVWDDMLSLEERAFQDLPWPSLVASLKLAQDDLKFPVYDNVRSKLQKELDKDLNQWTESPELKIAIGRAAKDSGWFKDITRGNKWFTAISPAFADPVFLKKNTAVKLASLLTWASNV